MHTRIILFVACLLALLGATKRPALAQAYGLTSRPDVGAYLDGILPDAPPTVPTNWTTVLAFPNLTFLNPVGLTQMPGTNRLVVWEREGRVYHFEKDAATSMKTLMLDVSNQCQGWDDSGFLGLAFHPNFITNRHVYVWYNYVAPGTVIGNGNTRPPTNTPTRNRLSRFTLDANGVAIPGSEFVILDQIDASVWHNGGGMFFHPDNGFLYITNGDDANTANTQKINDKLFSGVLRIDVDKRGGAISHAPPRRATNEISPNWPAHFIPNDNPFVGVADAREEFWAIGLRSPHRMTIDPPTGRIFIGDVGAGAREEITVIEPNEPFGANMQWSRIEGLNGDLVQPYIGINKRPIIDYAHGADGNAVIGGYVYRGTELPELVGKYIFGDNGTGRVWVLDENTTPPSKVLLATLPDGPGPNSGNDYRGLGAFGVDASNELYLCQLSSTAGRIYKLQRGGTPGSQLPPRLSLTGVFSDLSNLTPSNKLIPYALNAPFWSDHAQKSRWAVIPNGTTVGFNATGEWTFPEGSVFVKHFDLPVDDNNPAVTRRVETRLLVRTPNNAIYGATYRWRADNSDADLLDGDLTENIPIAISPLGTLTGADIGTPATTGSTSRTGDAVTITAGGMDIWNASDQFHFAHQQRSGDFDIRVRLESVTQANLYTKAGLMARESLAANSRHVYALAFPSNAARNNNVGGYEFQYRAATGGASVAIYPPLPQPLVNYPNTWLRLRREGNTFISFSSTDGVWWTEFARTTLALPQTVFFGLAVTAHTGSGSTTAKFHLQSTRIQPWYYPNRGDCITCHTQTAGGVLGLKSRQLNRDLTFPNGVTDNQIRAWNHVGLFSSGPRETEIPHLDRLSHHTDITATLEKRARSYLDANCANCHRPGGVQAFWDARFDTPLNTQGIVYGAVTNDLGITGARVVIPQDLSKSILYHRASTVGPNQMPPLAKNFVDQDGVSLLAAWISSLTPNTPPVVTLSSPLVNTQFDRFAPVILSATASDADGIMRIDFYSGATKIGEDATAPYSVTWNTGATGTHAIKAVAIDHLGNFAETTPISVTIVNPPSDFDVKINFQLGSAAVPAGYLEDDGALYGSRGGGLSYGWNFDCTGSARDRNLVTDQRYDTVIHMQKDANDVARTNIWEIAVPNGVYDVRVVVGDASYNEGRQQVTVEGIVAVDGVQDANNEFFDGTITVAVTDGRLTLAPGPQAVTCRICFTEITRVLVPPSISFSNVADGNAFVGTDIITLGANAADLDGTIVKVEFFRGDSKLGEDLSSASGWTWSGTLPIGAHILRAVAYDNDGRITNSSLITITVIPLELKMLSLTPAAGGGWTVQIGTVLPAGRNYAIESTDDFVTWDIVHSGESDGAPIVLQHVLPDVDRRFYRLRID